MTKNAQHPQQEEGCFTCIAKAVFGIVISLALSWGGYWLYHNAPSYLATLRDSTPSTHDAQPTLGPHPTAVHSRATASPRQSRIPGTPTPLKPSRPSPSTLATPVKPAPTHLSQMNNASWTKATHRQTYDTIAALPWISDGLTKAEAATAQHFFHTAVNDHQTISLLLRKQWLTDSISPSEQRVIEHFMYISKRNGAAARHLIEMLFLGSVSQADALLVEGLSHKAYRGSLATYMNNPRIADGITDDEVIRAVAATTIDSPAHLDSVLNPFSSTVETIQTATPHTPNLTLSIVRTGQRKATDTTLLVEDAIRFVEYWMDRNIPTNHVIVLLSDTAVWPGYEGVNYGQAIAYRQAGETADRTRRAHFRLGLVHEVAHYFWTGAEAWINEGMATTIELAFARAASIPTDMAIKRQHTCRTPTIQALTQLSPALQSDQFHCNYYLGQRLFSDLDKSMPEPEFLAQASTTF